jgi:HlyD family secretion protein
MSASGPRGEGHTSIRNLNLAGFAVIGVMVGGIGGWAATSQLAGAVIAPGSIVVESNVKKVQHPTGGIVGRILVREGSEVVPGQIVMRLDDTVTKSTLGVVRSQLDELTARQARLVAERDGEQAIDFPDELADRRTDPGVRTAIAGEEKLFESRRGTRNGQKAQFRERKSQTDEEIAGLTAQRAGKDLEARFITEELSGVAELFKKNLIPISRFMQLQREQARTEGERGQLAAEIARAKVKISETELQILQIDQDFRTEVLKDLRETQGKIAELKERVTAAEDQLKRVDIRAPQAGLVHQLAVHTVGGVIANGETIMLIVPESDDLVIDARVTPQDIDQLAIGARTAVRIMAGNQRTTPNIAGIVTRISADLTKEQQTNQSYYSVRITLDPEQVHQLDGLKLVPGMPAEVFVQTLERTPLEYLLKPLYDQVARTFRER